MDAQTLKNQIAKKGMIDVSGVKIPQSTVKELRDDDYVLFSFQTTQKITGQAVRMTVLAPPGITQRHIWENRRDIEALDESVTVED